MVKFNAVYKKRRGTRAVAAAMVGVLVFSLVSCSSSGDDEPEASSSPDTELTSEQQAIVDDAQAWLGDAAAVDDTTFESLTFTGLTTSPNVTHVTFGQEYDDHLVQDAEVVVHVRDGGEITGANNALTDARPADDATEEVSADEAKDNAGKAVQGTPTEVDDPELVWVQAGDELVLAWRVGVRTTDPVGSWRVLINATTGDALNAAQVATDRTLPVAPRTPGATVAGRGLASVKGVTQQSGENACDLPDGPSACVFLPDPIYASGGTLSDPSQANDFLTGEELLGLDDPASGQLVGEFVNADPEGAPVDTPEEPDGQWGQGRGQPGFESAMAYYWIDRVQREIQDLGFSDVRNESFPVFGVDPDTIDNAFYDGSEIVLGQGSDGINEGEDASGIIHEYGHAVLDQQAPGLLQGEEAGAYHEGFGDLLAFLTTVELRSGNEQVDAGCLFAWAESNECIRRIDNDRVYPDDLVNEVHEDGTIYSGAIFDIFTNLLAADGIDVADCAGSDACDEVRDRVLTTLLASHNYLNSGVTLPDIAAAYQTTNNANFDGADADLIEAAFAEHGLAGGSSNTIDADGNDTGSANDAAASVSFEITHSFRGDLDVTVGVSDPDGNDLCEPIVIHEPDSSDSSQDLSGQVDISDTDCAQLLPPSNDQLWFLRAEDTLPQDEGQIVSFTVFDGDTPFPALGLPKPIADADPDGTFAITNGSTDSVDTGTGTTDDVGDGPFMTLDLTHTYTGDLSIRAGVGQPDGTTLCSVQVLEPDPNDGGDGGISGDIDLSECADQEGPDADHLWFLQVIDTADLDSGTIDSLTLTAPDGSTFDFDDLPADIPDNDPDGVTLFTDGTGGGSSTNDIGAGDAPVASVSIDHSFQGDLAVTVGVLDADDNVLCEEPLATPDQSNSEEGLEVEAPVSDCADQYPPSTDRQWYLFVADTLAQDTGQVVSATLTGPDGETFTVDTPADIPDADPDGLLLFFS